MFTLAADTLPDNTGYVAAAYLALVAMVVIYLVITVIRLGRLERDIIELNELVDRQRERDEETVTS